MCESAQDRLRRLLMILAAGGQVNETLLRELEREVQGVTRLSQAAVDQAVAGVESVRKAVENR